MSFAAITVTEPDVCVVNPEDVPTEPHYAIFCRDQTIRHVTDDINHIECHTEPHAFIGYWAFFTREKWEARIRELEAESDRNNKKARGENFQPSYSACWVCPEAYNRLLPPDLATDKKRLGE